jgi:4-alpha-glucanotransferase
VNPEPLLAGILEPVFAIRTEDDLGVGDTEGVRQMIDWCARLHLHIFQTLPINETIDDNSPYNALSSLAIEPGTIAVSPCHLPDLTLATTRKKTGANCDISWILPVWNLSLPRANSRLACTRHICAGWRNRIRDS